MAGSADVKYRRVSHLTGISVTNPQNEDIGDIEDFIIDNKDGQVAYTIVSFGGFWGIGEKYAAVPTTAIDLQPRRGVARLDADRQTLESVAFESNNFPDLSSPEYAQRLRSQFKTAPYGTAYGYVAPQEQEAAAQRAWGAESEYNKHFNPEKITTIRGTVQSVGTFAPARGVSEGLRLRVRTDEGKHITVQAGPASYAEQQNVSLYPGDQVTITGSEAKIGWRSVFMASEIQKGNQTLRLRSRTGEPQWQTSMSQMRQPTGRPPTEVSPGQAAGTQPGRETEQQRSQSRQQQSGTGTY